MIHFCWALLAGRTPATAIANKIALQKTLSEKIIEVFLTRPKKQVGISKTTKATCKHKVVS